MFCVKSTNHTIHIVDKQKNQESNREVLPMSLLNPILTCDSSCSHNHRNTVAQLYRLTFYLTHITEGRLVYSQDGLGIDSSSIIPGFL